MIIRINVYDRVSSQSAVVRSPVVPQLENIVTAGTFRGRVSEVHYIFDQVHDLDSVSIELNGD